MKKKGSPRKFSIAINMQNMHLFMSVISALVFIVHIGYMILMDLAGVGRLAEFNIFSCVVYAFCMVSFFRHRFLFVTYFLFFAEISIFSTVMTWCIKDFCGFSTILAPVIPLLGLLGYIYKVKFNKKNYAFYILAFFLAMVFGFNTIKNYMFSSFGLVSMDGHYRNVLCVYSCVIESICVALISMVFCSVADSNNDSQNFRIEQLSLKLFITLSQTVEAKDLYTNGHSMRVAAYSEMIASAMGFSVEEQKKIYFCGLLHDIGKISIADEIINKNGKLTDEEYAEIKKHPVAGWNILHSIDEFPELAQVSRWHHERYDGRGYPDQKKGNETPIYVRIVSLADAYDAMTSNRSYRSIMERSRVISIIREEKGKQFDPDVSDVFLKILEKDHNYEMREKETPAVYDSLLDHVIRKIK